MNDDELPEFEIPSAQDAARFRAFRATLMTNFGIYDRDTAHSLAFAMSDKHPSLEPRDLTQALVDSFIVEGLKKLRRDWERIDVSQLSEEARQRHLVNGAELDAELRALACSGN